MWHDSLNLRIMWNSRRIIYGEILESNEVSQWGLCACYRTPYSNKKCEFWNNMENYLST